MSIKPYIKERNNKNMARIIEGERRIIKMSVDDIISIVREYQNLCKKTCCYEHTREILSKANIYIPEDI